MAKGSETFKWNLFPSDTPHICRECRKALRVPDVGEERHEFSSNRYIFLCTACQRAHVEASIRKRRLELGLA